jgi:exopolyphosphatase/guanosine-5'-triphosphate,3'-diphosphate pyrophosphatase
VEHRPARDHRFAVIDIGSNSVRLVVYEGSGRFPQVLFNEKVLCGLGRDIAATGNLSAPAMELALATLKRFAILINKMQVDEVRAVATAAMRDAENGKKFADLVRKSCRLPVEIISGEDEARLSGLGVLCGMPEAEGIVGDLGGGSLELVRVGAGRIFETVSLHTGPLLLLDEFKRSPEAARALLNKALGSLDWLKGGRGHDFYAVGGAWRALGRVQMSRSKYPLHVLHNYTIERSEVLALCAAVKTMQPRALAALPGIAIKRAEVLPLAAMIIEALFKKIEPSRMMISALGLREGLLFDRMAKPLKGRHPFIASCRDLADLTGRFPEHAKKLMAWTSPLFKGETEEAQRLRYAACILSDVGWRGHPDYRAEKVLLELLYGRFVGVDHKGCALVGLALYVCYGGVLGVGYARLAERLLSKEEIHRARIIGLVLRLGQRLSGGTSAGLKAAVLSHTPSTLILSVAEETKEIAGDVVVRRLEALARALGLKPEIHIVAA